MHALGTKQNVVHAQTPCFQGNALTLTALFFVAQMVDFGSEQITERLLKLLFL